MISKVKLRKENNIILRKMNNIIALEIYENSCKKLYNCGPVAPT